jgi:hypothetical protein
MYVLNENMFSNEIIYEKRLSFGKKNVNCKNDNFIWNYIRMHAKAKWLGEDYALTPMLGGRNKVV